MRLIARWGERTHGRGRGSASRARRGFAGLTRIPGRTFRWKGEYGYDLNTAKTLRTELGVFAGFRPKLAETLRESEFVFLANIDPEIQLEVLDQVKRPRFVACDTMNFWIEGKPDALRRTLSRVDALLINDAEARQLAGGPNLVRAAAAIRRLGPSTIVVKRGEYGAVMFSEGGLQRSRLSARERPRSHGRGLVRGRLHGTPRADDRLIGRASGRPSSSAA